MPVASKQPQIRADRIDTDAAAAVARALAHPARLRIVALLLARPGCIGYEIVDEIGLAQSTVSEHLRILKASGIVTGEIDRPRVCYSLNPVALGPLAELVEMIAARAADPDAAICRVAPGAERPVVGGRTLAGV
jgi:ArsR family transcriptional regulator